MTGEKVDVDQMMIDEWRQLGFYYDFDERLSVNQWRFYGSKEGLQNFIKLLNNYTNTPKASEVFEHEHYGPYSYLKVITLEGESMINADVIGGSIDNLKKLRALVAEKLDKAKAGQTFNIDKEFGTANTATAKFFVMEDGFDPVSMDELIVSGRQKVVNERHQQNK